MHSTEIISTNKVSKLICNNSIKLIDTRSSDEYSKGHIHGAINIHDFFTYLVTSDDGGIDVMLEYFEKKLGDNGVSNSDDVVVYEKSLDSMYGQSCRAWFILKLLGHRSVSIMEGGYQAWCDKNLETTTEKPIYSPSNYVSNRDFSILAQVEDVKIAISDPEIKIIDCRDYDEWIGVSSSPYGKDFAPRKGRIPQSKWIEWNRLLNKRGAVIKFRSPKELEEIFNVEGIQKDSKIILYCFKGSRSSNTYMAMRSIGMKNVTNYLGSWNEWSRNVDLPIEKTINMSVYTTVMEKRIFSDVEKQKINERLDCWLSKTPYGRRISDNIRKEKNLPELSMEKLLRLILNDGFSECKIFEKLYEEECYKHVRKGNPITPENGDPILFGTAIEKNKLIDDFLHRHSSIFKKKKDIEDFLWHIENNNTLPGTRHINYDIMTLKEHSIWSTWNEVDSASLPFDFTTSKDAEEVRANLGLEMIGRSRELLLFVSNKSKLTMTKHIPTIADGGLSEYFEPNTASEIRYGRTVTWHVRPVHLKKHYSIGPRPECIHKSQTLLDIELPIEIRK